MIIKTTKGKTQNNFFLIRSLSIFVGSLFFLSSFSQNVDKVSTVYKKTNKPIENTSLSLGYLVELGMDTTTSGYKERMVPVIKKYRSDAPLTTNNAITLSVGSVSMLDTYLSPLEYKGISLRLMYEQMRRTTWFDYRFYKQQVFELDFAKGDNPAKNVSEYWVLANYRIGGHSALYSTDAFRFGVGGLWDINGGVLYNERNGNNPASARAYSNLNLSLTASYKLKWFAVRWQLDTPFMGVMFSPKYGQSYYEISLGNSVGLVNFASLHNQRALRNYLTVDIPINKYTIRLGYLGSWYQTKVHDIQTHHYTNSFVIGFPIESIKRPKEKARNNYWDGY